ncbi:hypothetical protein [Candidatus Nitrospira salsa]|nr:MAG: hypothetical protein NPIRA01_37900 [Nitrospirales bacterium]
MFLKGDQHCKGQVTLQENSKAFLFESMEGNLCEGLEGGRFKYISSSYTTSARRLQLTWFPANTTIASIEGLLALRQSNELGFSEAQTVPPSLQTAITGFETDIHLASLKIPEEAV